MVLAGHVVWHKIDDDFEPGIVCTAYQRLKLGHAVGHAFGQVGVDIVIIGDGVWRPCLAFHNRWMVGRQPIPGVIGLRGMANDSRIPHMTYAHLTHGGKLRSTDGVEFATTVFINCAVLARTTGAIAEQTGKDLVNDNFLTHRR